MAGRDTEVIYVIDTKAMAITTQWPTTPGCGATNSVTLDKANNRLMLGCRGNKDNKPSFAVMDIATGKIVYSSEIGAGNDGIAYDPETKRVFLTNGVSAILNVFEQVDANTYRQIEAVGIPQAARTLAYDARGKRLFTAASEGIADYSKKVNTVISPWYHNTFTPNTFRVLVYGRN